MLSNGARFEFRIWDDDLRQLRDAIQRVAKLDGHTDTQELYVISRAPDCNAKIRSGQMEIKRRITMADSLERWQPVLKAPFPLTAPVADRVFTELGLPPPRLEHLSYPIDEFLTALAKACGAPRLVRVAKNRERFSVGVCRAEYCNVKIDGVARDSVAAESSDAVALRGLLRQLGLDGRPNLSYVAEIMRILGMIST